MKISTLIYAIRSCDGAGQVTNEAQRASGSARVSVSWGYDASGLLNNTVLSTPNSSLLISNSYSYDSASRLSSLSGTLELQNSSTLELPLFSYSYCGWNGRVSAVSNALYEPFLLAIFYKKNNLIS